MKTQFTLFVSFLLCFGFVAAQKATKAERNTPTALGAAQPATPLNLNEVLAEINYPVESMQKNIACRVVYTVLVDSKGQVESFYSRNSVHSPFVDSVHKHIPAIRFQPAKDVQGNAIQSWVTLPVLFRPQ
jgi:TonB family protein